MPRIDRAKLRAVVFPYLAPQVQEEIMARPEDNVLGDAFRRGPLVTFGTRTLGDLSEPAQKAAWDLIALPLSSQALAARKRMDDGETGLATYGGWWSPLDTASHAAMHRSWNEWMSTRS